MLVRCLVEADNLATALRLYEANRKERTHSANDLGTQYLAAVTDGSFLGVRLRSFLHTASRACVTDRALA